MDFSTGKRENLLLSSKPLYSFRGHEEGTQWVKADPHLDESPVHRWTYMSICGFGTWLEATSAVI